MALLSKVGSLLKQSEIKHVSVGFSSTNSALFQAIRSMSSAKLFVGGLAYATDEMGLREAFQQYGEVIDAKVITDRDSGRSRGFGFVSFTSADAANSALQDMDGKELHGRRIRINFAEERPRPSFGGGRYEGPGGGGGGSGYEGAGGYSGGGYGGGGGYGASNRNNVGGNGGGNHNVAGGENLFSGGLGGASGAAPGSGNEGDYLTLDLAEKGGDDYEVDDYANTSDK